MDAIWNNVVCIEGQVKGYWINSSHFLATINREYVLLAKDPLNDLPPSRAVSFNGLDEALTVNRTNFAGHFNNEFTIRMLMRHSVKSADKEHLFCKSDEKCMLNKRIIDHWQKTVVVFSFSSEKSSSYSFVYSKWRIEIINS